MRRRIDLTNEWARHPFRAQTLLLEPLYEEPLAEAVVVKAPSQLREDVTFFLVSFAAGFIIIFGMIA